LTNRVPGRIIERTMLLRLTLAVAMYAGAFELTHALLVHDGVGGIEDVVGLAIVAALLVTAFRLSRQAIRAA
jgi:hypothetical protein